MKLLFMKPPCDIVLLYHMIHNYIIYTVLTVDC